MATDEPQLSRRQKPFEVGVLTVGPIAPDTGDGALLERQTRVIRRSGEEHRSQSTQVRLVSDEHELIGKICAKPAQRIRFPARRQPVA